MTNTRRTGRLRWGRHFHHSRGHRGATIPVAQHDRRAARRAERDAPPPRRLGAAAGGCKLAALEHGAHYDFHLEHREAGAQAAPTPTAERKPGIGAGLSTQEAFGAERE